jgi:hypothetical protein
VLAGLNGSAVAEVAKPSPAKANAAIAAQINFDFMVLSPSSPVGLKSLTETPCSNDGTFLLAKHH